MGDIVDDLFKGDDLPGMLESGPEQGLPLGWDDGWFDVVSAILDRATCGRCWDLDGTMVPVGEDVPGAGRPQFHRSCRCEMVSVLVPEGRSRKLPGLQIDYAQLKDDIREYMKGASLDIGVGVRHAEGYIREVLGDELNHGLSSPEVLTRRLYARDYFPNAKKPVPPKLPHMPPKANPLVDAETRAKAAQQKAEEAKLKHEEERKARLAAEREARALAKKHAEEEAARKRAEEKAIRLAKEKAALEEAKRALEREKAALTLRHAELPARITDEEITRTVEAEPEAAIRAAEFLRKHRRFKALEGYTGENYDLINKALRSPGELNDHALGICLREVEMVSQVIADAKQAGFAYEGVVLRGERISGLPPHILEMYRTREVGELIQFDGFLSTTSSKGVVYSFGDGVTLKLRQASGIPLDAISKHRGEHEILLPPGSKFRLISREMTAEGGIVLELEEVRI